MYSNNKGREMLKPAHTISQGDDLPCLGLPLADSPVVFWSSEEMEFDFADDDAGLLEVMLGSLSDKSGQKYLKRVDFVRLRCGSMNNFFAVIWRWL
jgi:hypothetical protein